MDKQLFNRRNFLRATAASGMAVSSRSWGDTPVQRTLDLADPEDCLTAMVKMRASLVAEDSPNWYFGTIYGVLPDKAPIAMVDFEGSEIDYYEKQPDGSYKAYAATVSFFRDTRTRKRIDVFDNPITGKRNEVRPNSISVKAHYIYSVFGSKRSDDDRPLATTPVIQDQLKWTESGDYIWLNTRRPYPTGLAMGEDQTVQGSLRELHDPDTPKVYATASPTYISPWLSWMDMQGHPGHTVWAGPARKVDSVTEYPRELLDYLEKNFPHKLSAKPSG
jgi:hypothetical protein